MPSRPNSCHCVAKPSPTDGANKLLSYEALVPQMPRRNGASANVPSEDALMIRIGSL